MKTLGSKPPENKIIAALIAAREAKENPPRMGTVLDATARRVAREATTDQSTMPASGQVAKDSK